jgi:hypothetical protein
MIINGITCEAEGCPLNDLCHLPIWLNSQTDASFPGDENYIKYIMNCLRDLVSNDFTTCDFLGNHGIDTILYNGLPDANNPNNARQLYIEAVKRFLDEIKSRNSSSDLIQILQAFLDSLGQHPEA